MTSTQVTPESLGIPAARDFPMLIDGQWVEATSGKWTEVTTPILRGHVIGRVPAAEVADVDRAVAAARVAFPSWRAQHFTGRQKVLARIADAIAGVARAIGWDVHLLYVEPGRLDEVFRRVTVGEGART